MRRGRGWLTKSTAIEFYSERNELVPSLRVDSDVSCDNRISKVISNDCVVVVISLKHLKINKPRNV